MLSDWQPDFSAGTVYCLRIGDYKSASMVGLMTTFYVWVMGFPSVIISDICVSVYGRHTISSIFPEFFLALCLSSLFPFFDVFQYLIKLSSNYNWSVSWVRWSVAKFQPW